MISVVIPSRVSTYLQKTIDDVLEKADGEVEIIVVLDGYWPDPALKDDPRVKIVHQGTIHNNLGMRAAINVGMALAEGEYVMKLDEHCMMDRGWDAKLTADIEDDWIVVPRRYRLDADAWELTTKTENDKRPPVDYMFIAYPYERPFDRRCGLYGGGIDLNRYYQNKNVEIDETMSMQGSCYFAKKSYWQKLFPDGMDDVNYGKFNHEAQEIHFKAQLSGGKLMVNKKTWYAHYHKGKNGKGYGFSREQYRQHEWDKEKARRYALDYWLTTQDYEHDFGWLIDKFWPIPGWPENWRDKIKEDEKNDWRYHPDKQPSEWINEKQN